MSFSEDQLDALYPLARDPLDMVDAPEVDENDPATQTARDRYTRLVTKNRSQLEKWWRGFRNAAKLPVEAYGVGTLLGIARAGRVALAHELISLAPRQGDLTTTYTNAAGVVTTVRAVPVFEQALALWCRSIWDSGINLPVRGYPQFKLDHEQLILDRAKDGGGDNSVGLASVDARAALGNPQGREAGVVGVTKSITTSGAMRLLAPFVRRSIVEVQL